MKLRTPKRDKIMLGVLYATMGLTLILLNVNLVFEHWIVAFVNLGTLAVQVSILINVRKNS